MTNSTSDTVADDPLPPRGFNTKSAARYVGLSTSWLRKARMGITAIPGPRFKKVGRKNQKDLVMSKLKYFMVKQLPEPVLQNRLSLKLRKQLTNHLENLS